MKMLEQVPPEHRAKAMEAMRGRMGRGQPQPNAQPQGEAKPAEGEKKPEENKEKKEEGKTIKRPTEQKDKPNAEELKAKPDKDGLVEFNFRNQPWLDVLEWFAQIGEYTFDWQELPADSLNLSTQRKYKVDETRDLLNRHLLARGFTIIIVGDSMSVVKTDKIDPSMVPRVEPDDLDDHMPHEFVRTRFQLPDALDPAKAAEDVTILLSPAKKVTPLLVTKQLQIIDAVTNLRDVRDLLYAEQIEADKDVRPKPFFIKHRRAEYICDQVMVVLGLDPSSRKQPMELQLEQQKMQLMMQMSGQGKDISKMLKNDGPPVFIAVDDHLNAILVNAPPKEMEMVALTIKQFDVPEHEIAASRGPDRQLRLEKYPTNSAEEVVNALKKLGTLDPLTQLQSDDRADVIFAYATESDHEIIKKMIDKLDGEGRSGRVVPLNRRMAADQAAGTIQALLVGEKKEEDDSNSRSRYFGFYGGYGGGDRGNSRDGEFRIQADIENNRLLLWANDAEYKEVMTLLETLGAVSSGRNKLDRMRVWEAGTPEQTAQLLERLQQNWGGANKLQIEIPPAAKPPAVEKPAEEAAPAEEEPNRDKLTDARAIEFTPQPKAWLAQFSAEAEAPLDEPEAEVAPAEKPAEAPPAKEEPPVEQPAADSSSKPTPPVKITITEDGRIVLLSDDVEALDQLEELMAELAPPPKEFETFILENALPFDVYLNLKDYFAEELKGQTESVFDMWGDYAGTRDKKSGPSSLGKRRPLRFIYDDPTSTIVVQNASESQLEVISRLIDIYDQDLSEGSVITRQTKAIKIKYSQASVIATALKEVYRDLLSSKDKEFQNRDGEQKQSSRTETYFRFAPAPGSDDKDKKKSPVKVAFEGALSIGVDEISNSLIISAEENVFESVEGIIMLLDEQAKPNTIVQVHELRGTLQGKDLKAALAAALSQPWAGGKPPAAAGGQQNGGGENGDNNRRRGDGERSRRDRDNNDGDNND